MSSLKENVNKFLFERAMMNLAPSPQKSLKQHVEEVEAHLNEFDTLFDHYTGYASINVKNFIADTRDYLNSLKSNV